MNNKARIFISAYGRVLSSYPEETRNVNRACIPTEISKILLEISHLYLYSATRTNYSDYWMAFVFDTCCSIGLCSNRYISHLTTQEKRDYINKTLEDRLRKSNESSLDFHEVTNRICAYARSDKDLYLESEREERQTTSAILEFIHVLISIDRTTKDCEYEFFRSIRDNVYQLMGWTQQAGLPTLDANNCLSMSSSGHRQAPHSPPNPVSKIILEIDKLIGLDNIKNEIKSLMNSLQVQRLRRSAGLLTPEISNHMVFYGNPGTGKTTIARRLAELYYSLGVLSKGHFVETDRSGLVGGYLGQTAIKTTELLESALGGILFIDEAYSLSQSESSDQYGQEAIDTLLKYMEDNRGDIVVIVAGYGDLMGKFLQSNPGIKSRFNKYFYFNDYSEDELSRIFLLIAETSNYSLDVETQSHLHKVIHEMVQLKTKNFGNGRTVRNLFERSIANQANRIIESSVSDKDGLTCLSKEDIRWEDVLEVSR